MSGDTDPSDSSDRRSQRRTNVVFLLGRMEMPVTVDELVDELQRHAERQPGVSQTREPWEDLHERLHEDDLPALDQAGLVTFDAERGLITRARPPEHGPFAPTPEPEEAARSDDGPDRTPDEPGGDSSIARYQLGLTLLATVVLAVTVFGVGPFADISQDRVATGLVIVLVAASFVTALHYGR